MLSRAWEEADSNVSWRSNCSFCRSVSRKMLWIPGADIPLWKSEAPLEMPRPASPVRPPDMLVVSPRPLSPAVLTVSPCRWNNCDIGGIGGGGGIVHVLPGTKVRRGTWCINENSHVPKRSLESHLLLYAFLLLMKVSFTVRVGILRLPMYIPFAVEVVGTATKRRRPRTRRQQRYFGERENAEPLTPVCETVRTVWKGPKNRHWPNGVRLLHCMV
jgi:hypothetical protein